MREIFIVLFLLPGTMFAQLDRVRIDMSENDFIKAFPEATRDYEAESFWMNAWDTIEGTRGNSMWRILADTVTQYNFRSLTANGPSYRFPKVDSARVLKMIVSARKLTMQLDAYYGIPQVIIDKPLVGTAPAQALENPGQIAAVVKNEVYFAKWNFADGTQISITVSADLGGGNQINAPAVQQEKTEETYELVVIVTHSSKELPWSFEVGRSATEMTKRYPRIQAGVGNSFSHTYKFPDKELSGKASWQFVFQKEKLTSMQYYTANGLYYGDMSTEGSYSQCKYRAEKLLAEGQTAFGKPDSVYNSIVPEYTSFEMETKYQYPYLYAEWDFPNGKVYLIFDELGGSKEGTRFSVRVFYPMIL